MLLKVARAFFASSWRSFFFASSKVTFHVLLCRSPIIHSCSLHIAWSFHGCCFHWVEPKIQAARDGDLEALQQLLVIIISSCLFIGDMVLVAVACCKKTCRCHGVSSFLSEFATVDGQDPTDRLGWLNFRDSGILLISTDQQLEGILSHFSQFEVGGWGNIFNMLQRVPWNISTTSKKITKSTSTEHQCNRHVGAMEQHSGGSKTLGAVDCWVAHL